MGAAERGRPALDGSGAPPRPRTRRRPRQPRAGHSGSSGHRIQGNGTDGKFHATDPDRGRRRHGDQQDQNVTEIRYGVRVEASERDRDEHGGNGTRCDQPWRPITTPQRPELTPEMPHEGCKQPGSLNLHPQSHLNLRPRCPYKSFHVNQIPTQHTTPTCRERCRGGRRGATTRKPAGFPTRPVFLRHTRRVAVAPQESSVPEGQDSRRDAPRHPSSSHLIRIFTDPVGSWKMRSPSR